MLTPREIHEIEFRRVLRGYEPAEVDAFVERVVKSYEALYQENKNLKARLRKAEEALRSRSERSDLTEEVLRLAQQAAQDLKQAAEREAEALLTEARTQAADLLAEAERDLAALERRIDWLRNEELRFRQRLRQIFREGLELLDSEPPGEPSERGVPGALLRKATGRREAAAQEPQGTGPASLIPAEMVPKA